MTPRTLIAASAVALVVLAGSQPAPAQTRYDFKVPFSFVAQAKTFAAGEYVLSVNDAQQVVTLEAKDPKAGGALLAVETRVSERKPLKEPEVVFDKLDGKLYVSELLVPGDDGYLSLVTKAKHTHESVKAAPVQEVVQAVSGGSRATGPAGDHDAEVQAGALWQQRRLFTSATSPQSNWLWQRTLVPHLRMSSTSRS